MGYIRHTQVCRRETHVHGRLLIYPQISANLITAGLNVSRIIIFTCLSQDLQDVQVFNKINALFFDSLIVARC